MSARRVWSVLVSAAMVGAVMGAPAWAGSPVSGASASGQAPAGAPTAGEAAVGDAAGLAGEDAGPQDAGAGVETKNSYASGEMLRVSGQDAAIVRALGAAQRSNTQVEIPELTDEVNRAWAMPDGSVRNEQAVAPVRAKVNGSWQGLDATLVKAGDGSWGPRVAAAEMRFSGGGGGPLARISRDGVELSYTFPAVLPAPAVDGTSLTYPEVYRGVDLVVTVSGSTFSQVLVVKDRRAGQDPRVRSWTLGAAVSGGVLEGDGAGGYRVKKSSTPSEGEGEGGDVVVFTGAAPNAWDSATSTAGAAATTTVAPQEESSSSSGRPPGGPGAPQGPGQGRKVGHPAPGVGARQAPIGLRVSPGRPGAGSSWVGSLELAAPGGLLDDPATVFPVVLDPTTSLALNRWFMVDAAYPNQSYANYTGSATSSWGNHEASGFNNYAGTFVRRLFFEYSNARMADKAVTRATFIAHEAFSATCDAGAGTSAHILTQEIATPVTWNNQPGSMTTSLGTYSGKTNPTYCNNGRLAASWDMTASVRARVNLGAPTTTVTLRGSNEGSNSSWMRWLDPTSSYTPMLYVDYLYTGVPALADLAVAAPGVGMQSWYPTSEFSIREGLSLAVNLANGNAMLRDTDLKTNAPGVGSRLDRWYNSLAQTTGSFGPGWKSGTGSDLRLVEDTSLQRVWLVGPSGFVSGWNAVGGSWKADDGLNATLRKWSDGSYSVYPRASGQRWDFAPNGQIGNQYSGNGTGVGLSYAYNGDGTTKSITDAGGRVMNFAYTAGRVSSVTQTGTDGATRAVSYTYHGTGRLATSTDADGHTTTYSYDGANRVNQVVTARGVKVTLTYDGSGRVASVSRYDDAGAAQTWTLAYLSATSTRVIDANGGYWWYSIDATKRFTGVSDPYGNKTSREYGPSNHNVAKAIDAMGSGGAGGNVTNFSWDTANNPTQVALPTTASNSVGYAAADAPCQGANASGVLDRATCLTDAAGNKTGLTWDASGNLTKTVQGAGATGAATSTFTYQAVSGAAGSDTACGGKKGQVCTGTDPKGWKTTYGYDGRGNLISVTPANTALLGARSFGYDGFGRVVTATDGRGQMLTYTWDQRDHLTGIAGAATVAYAWDGDGNQTANQGASIGYDLQNRAKTLTIGGKTTSVTFDKVGNIASFTDENGKTTTYTYFWHNRVASIGVDGAACAWGRETSPQTMPTATPTSQAGCVKFRYDNNGNETARALPGGVTQSKAYDASGRVTAVSSAKAGVSGLLTSQGYTYTTPAGADRTSVQSWITGAATQSPGPVNLATQAYSYDALDRLTGVVEKSGSATVASWAYGYDGMGNRTSQTRTGTTGTTTGAETATYNAASQLTSNSYGSFTYDKNGNEITAPGLPAATVPARAGTFTDPLGNATAMTIAGAAQAFTYGGTSPGLYNQLLTGDGKPTPAPSSGWRWPTTPPAERTCGTSPTRTAPPRVISPPRGRRGCSPTASAASSD